MKPLPGATKIKVVPRTRKTRALNRAVFGCLRGGHTLNITWGCSLSCVYCYARGYSQAPPAGTVELYTNLPQLLEVELRSTRRRYPLRMVYLNTTSDCFQPHPDILDLTYRVMELLLNAGVRISFLTKGEIPDRFFTLFKKHPGLVTPRIGLVSVDEEYASLFEPGAAPPQIRLKNIRKLKEANLNPLVRADPIIPLVTDTPQSVDRLIKALKQAGAREVSLNYLHLRPGIWPQLRSELPSLQVKLLEALFSGANWQEVGGSSRGQLLPRKLREKGYHLFREAAHRYGLRALVCACKNPDLPASPCFSVRHPPLEDTPGERQLELFPRLPVQE